MCGPSISYFLSSPCLSYFHQHVLLFSFFLLHFLIWYFPIHCQLTIVSYFSLSPLYFLILSHSLFYLFSALFFIHSIVQILPRFRFMPQLSPSGLCKCIQSKQMLRYNADDKNGLPVPLLQKEAIPCSTSSWDVWNQGKSAVVTG